MPNLLCNLLSGLVFLFLTGAAQASETGGKVLSFEAITGVRPNVGIEEISRAGYFAEDAPKQTFVRPEPGGSVTWLRISEPLAGGLVQISPVVDRATLYAPTPDAGWQTAETGDLVANSAKLLPSPFMALPLPGRLDDRAIYIRIEQQVPVLLSIRHWSLPAFSAMQSRDRTLKMLLVGVIGAMIIYNLFVSAVVRDPAFALNAVTISALLVVALYLSGYGAAHVWAALTEFSNVILFAGIVTAIVAGGAFMWLFLRPSGEPIVRGWPLLAPPLAAIFLSIALLVLPLWLGTLLALALGGILFVIALGVCVTRAINGEQKARLLLFPLVFAMIPGVIMVILDEYLGVRLPHLGSNGMEITLCLEALMFSLALASRIRITEVEARQASERIVALQNEAAIRSIRAQDDERRRLSKELHDGVGQDFLMVLGSLKQLTGTPGASALQPKLQTLVDAAGNALGNLRRISRDMHPASLEHLGLARALEDLVQQARTVSQLDIDLICDCEERALDADKRLHVYRIVQECISNILRHARAGTCRIDLHETGKGTISLTIEDDGIGFGERGAGDSGRIPGLGLTSIDERARACGGRLRIGASGSGGARVEIMIPSDRTGSESG